MPLNAGNRKGQGALLLPTFTLCRRMTAMLHVFKSGCAAERLDAAREFLSGSPASKKGKCRPSASPFIRHCSRRRLKRQKPHGCSSRRTRSRAGCGNRCACRTRLHRDPAFVCTACSGHSASRQRQNVMGVHRLRALVRDPLAARQERNRPHKAVSSSSLQFLKGELRS